MKNFILTILLLLLFAMGANAQFYNGLQMTFGKNRIQYRNFNWLYYRYDNYDIYFYDRGRQLAQFTAEYTEEIIPELEQFFGYKLQKRLIILVYNKQTDFKQSNLGLESENVSFNTGGTTQINDNKIFIYYEENHEQFKLQIKKVISEVILKEMLYGSAFKDKVANSTLITVPEWFEKGLIEYASNDWNFETENTVKDGIMSGKYNNFNHLTGKEAAKMGHSFWYYIAQTYGEDAISNVIYFTRINKNANSGFSYVTGMSIKQIKPEWYEFFKIKYEEQDENKTLPENKIIEKRVNKNTVYQQVKLNPKKNQVAFVTNTMGKYKIFIQDLDTEKKQKIYVEGQKLEQITDFSYPLIAWHPTGTVISFITEEKGDIIFTQYLPETDEYRKRTLMRISKVSDFSYSQKGQYIVLSAVKDGYTDIFVYNVGSGTFKQITNDLADDLNPHFIENSSKIIFSSNRISDTLKVERHYEDHAKIANFYDVFVYDLKSENTVLTRITNTKYINETQPVELDKNKYLFLSNENGITNKHLATYDSTISHIDTTVHYKYYTTNYAISNYSRNIISYDINSKTNKIAELIFTNNKYYMFLSDFDTEKNPDIIKNYKKTDLRKSQDKSFYLKDSLKLAKSQKDILEQQKIENLDYELPTNYQNPDSTLIDINNYTFEIERDTIYRLYYLKLKRDLEKDKKIVERFPQHLYYQTTFYMDDIMSQIDFGMLNQSYQTFTGKPFYFNPGMNMFLKMSINELFENYKITGGIKIGFSLNSYEHILSVENLSKRLDKQIIFHRTSYKNEESNWYAPETKTITNELMYIVRYPFSQTTSFKATSDIRFDKSYYLSKDWNTLVADVNYNVFASIKTEFIFDNIRNIGVNLYDGLRYKIFSEFHQKTHGDFEYIGIFGADFRYYKKIHRNLIFATRFAASTSLGSGKLIYYLGGVDNWYSLMAMLGEEQYVFDPTVNINPDENYIYQAVATNMRGFRQNIRNGNTFALSNTELRFPIIKYFTNRPLSSDFFNNFQVVGFFDVGSAWSGISPFDEDNAYNQVIVENGSVTVTIDVDRPPFVMGYGWGLRSKLFGYFFRLDWAWGVEGNYTHPRQFYFSLDLDF